MCTCRGRNWFILCYEVVDDVDDTAKDAQALAKKILSLRIFNDESNQQLWKRSVIDVDGEILCGNCPG
jgi:D-Tyr-tRNAtyr deacylase